MDVALDILRVILTNEQVLQFFGIVISAMLIWLLRQLMSWVGLKIHSDRLALLSAAIDKAMTFAVTKLDDVIREKGWDHLDTRIEIINAAVPVLEAKFADTLRMNGIDLSDAQSRQKIREQMERMLPDVLTRAAASPVTPPAPVVPVAVVHPNQGV